MRHLVVLCLLCAAAPVRAQPDGAYRLGGLSMRAEPDALLLTHGRYATRYVRLGPRIEPSRVVISASSNANDEFSLFMRYAPGDCARAVLRLGPHLTSGDSHGNSPRECTASVTLDADLAARAAAHFGVPRQDRRPLAEAVRARFGAPASARAGQPVEVWIELDNPSDAPAILHQIGGRDRGPRDNRFTFSVRRDGVVVPPIDGPDFGGLTGFSRLGPGERARRSARLDRWADLSVPGTYEVECAYETTFAPEGANPSADDERGRVWDRRFTGAVRFAIRP
ncbi:MAG: hypothetical protein KF729_12025 [Sandaracinaceae bacterium]|nr:hypothetical protein [Sandaracinaceae bacterium]